MEVKKTDNEILFGDKIVFTQEDRLFNDKINLLAQKGPSITKKKSNKFVINYPGEYEKYNIYIQALCGQTDRLNYFITDYNTNEFFAFIQDPSVLENLDLAKYPEKWYYLDDVVFNQIERLGFEGETIKIE